MSMNRQMQSYLPWFLIVTKFDNKHEALSRSYRNQFHSDNNKFHLHTNHTSMQNHLIESICDDVSCNQNAYNQLTT
jgi:hypothetical protein